MRYTGWQQAARPPGKGDKAKMDQVLVVIDMQNDFVTGALGTPEAQAILPAVTAAIADPAYALCYATLDTHSPDYAGTLEGKKLPVPHCIRGTEGWRLAPAVAAALTGRKATLLEKPTFGSLELARAILRQTGALAGVTLCGVCTDICVVSNALLLRAFCPDLPIRVLAKACAGTTPAAHQAALATMANCQIDVIA